ncbi:MAG: 2-dehydropantoate 2-reductase [Burkholderiales bacterium]|nr:2-dehydropantoate 2-reductase [Burkholderiales bacterium]
MKVCIVGAGAIGGLLAARFAHAGFSTSVVARGDHLAAIRERGLTLASKGEEVNVRVAASDDPQALAREVGQQEVVFLALKAHQIPAMLPRLAPLIEPESVVVPAINGIPWWYFFREGGRFDGQPVRALDREGVMFSQLDPHRVVGCVVHAAAEVSAPGRIAWNGQGTFILGEPDGSLSRRINALADAMTRAGLEPKVSERIRDEVWMKLIGNTSFNPVAALTRARMDRINANAGLVTFIRAVMEELTRVADAYDIRRLVSIDRRLEIARSIGPVRASMLQDLEAGRAMEVEPLMGAVLELAAKVGLDTPLTATLYALTSELGANLSPGRS